MSTPKLTDAEKIAFVNGFDPKGSQTVDEYCKAHKHSTGMYYSWRKELVGGKIKERPAKMRVVRGEKLGAEQKLKAQNEVLKEMLAEAYAEKKAA